MLAGAAVGIALGVLVGDAVGSQSASQWAGAAPRPGVGADVGVAEACSSAPTSERCRAAVGARRRVVGIATGAQPSVMPPARSRHRGGQGRRRPAPRSALTSASAEASLGSRSVSPLAEPSGGCRCCRGRGCRCAVHGSAALSSSPVGEGTGTGEGIPGNSGGASEGAGVGCDVIPGNHGGRLASDDGAAVGVAAGAAVRGGVALSSSSPVGEGTGTGEGIPGNSGGTSAAVGTGVGSSDGAFVGRHGRARRHAVGAWTGSCGGRGRRRARRADALAAGAAHVVRGEIGVIVPAAPHRADQVHVAVTVRTPAPSSVLAHARHAPPATALRSTSRRRKSASPRLEAVGRTSYRKARPSTSTPPSPSKHVGASRRAEGCGGRPAGVPGATISSRSSSTQAGWSRAPARSSTAAPRPPTTPRRSSARARR